MDTTVNTNETSTNNQIRSVQKPDRLKMNDRDWRHLVTAVQLRDNVMIVGESGCGKTEAARQVSTALGRDLLKFNLGSTEQARSTLIGTREAVDGSTKFVPSAFVTAIQRDDNPIILLDEFTRASKDAWNILITVLEDPENRFIRIGVGGAEKDHEIKVHPGVSFIATSNVGVKYTATKKMDYAFQRRFTTIEMDPLNREDEYELLKTLYPSVDVNHLWQLAGIAHKSRQAWKSENNPIDRIISTDQTLRAAQYLRAGSLTFREIAETILINGYSSKGQVTGSSPRETAIEWINSVKGSVPDDANIQTPFNV